MEDNNNDFFDSNKKTHLDDIDEFFYKNFTNLLNNTNYVKIEDKKDKYEEIEILDIEEIEVLKIEDSEEIEILKIEDSEEIEILNIEKTEEIEILDIEEPKEIEILDIEEPEEIEKLDIEDSEEIEKSNIEKIDNQIVDDLQFQSNQENPKRNNSNKKIFLIIIFIILLILLIFVIYKIVLWFTNNNSIDKQIDEIQSSTIVEEVIDNENTIIIDNENLIENEVEDNIQIIDKNNDYWNFIEQPLISVDFSELLKKNSDTIGWLQVNGTNINYPIVQYTDNSYYLTHSFDKTYNDAGWIFVDFRNNLIDDKNMIIYGHSRLNSTMFGTLKNVVKSSWYKNSSNHLIKMSTVNSNTSWQVFSTYIIDEEDYYIKTDFNTNEEYFEFLQTLKNRSVYNYSVTVNENDRIITLSTCYTNNQRVVLHAKLIKMENRE